ncbi:MAG TPA: metal-dependent hydrolase [Bryobacteraceae bacterium]|jgi:inner membrane protein|nr:metal-dependent hydrolase [Bryobacteraceae bacterium]
MDNVTHSLTGLALSRAGLNRYSPHATALLLVSANLPDADFITAFKGPLTYLEYHRGYTHSILCLPVMAVLSVLIVAAVFRTRLPWGKAWLLCCIGLASHVLLDWTNSYGIRLLLPFSSRWFHLDCTSLYDGWIMAALVFAAIWPWFSRLVSREIGSRERPGHLIAICALLFLALFDCARLVLHARAISQLQARLFENAPPLETAAMPQAFSLFRWGGIVETERTYQALPVDTLGQIDTASAQIFFKPPYDPAIDAARSTETFRYGLYFARFPVWSESRVSLDAGAGVRVELTDLRFGRPQSGSFHCIALENAGFRVLQDWFTFGSGMDLGWGKSGPPAEASSD